MQDLYEYRWAGIRRPCPKLAVVICLVQALFKPNIRLLDKRMTASLKEYHTGFPADAVEFCPHPLALDILVCGTYKLLEGSDHAGKQRRIGRSLFLSVSADGEL